MVKKTAKLKIKNPHGGDMDYKVEKLKVMTPERKAEIEAKAKAKAKPADKKKAKKK
jgi:hypothetical protein